jgi:hypothetical protein
MDCCGQCQSIETIFDRQRAAKQLEDYHKNGPLKATRLLLEALKARGVEDATLLDIGGGIGAIQHELLRAGAASATHVDASTAYLQTAREEAERQGLADRVSRRFGDFVDLAPDIPSADIVTLDRVICCYHDMPMLVGLSSERARRWYGLIYPRDTWWMRLAIGVINFTQWLRRDPFRTFVNAREAIDAVARGNGLQPFFRRNTWLWQVTLYERIG